MKSVKKKKKLYPLYPPAQLDKKLCPNWSFCPGRIPIRSILPSPLPRFPWPLLLLLSPPTLQSLLFVRDKNPDYSDNSITSELDLSKRYAGDDDCSSNLHWLSL